MLATCHLLSTDLPAPLVSSLLCPLQVETLSDVVTPVEAILRRCNKLKVLHNVTLASPKQHSYDLWLIMAVAYGVSVCVCVCARVHSGIELV